ncbi:MAG TPA: ABC transporter substrate-binding protein, partial [Thermomicrobiales bacterium]|nr:ABC transporter substrate-binding protein [Thermomicrobiales bacterium]
LQSANAQSGTPAASPAADGEWSFTDDKNVTVTLPQRPVRVVADINTAAALWDFGVRPVAVFGWNVAADGSFNAAAGNVDPKAVEIVGNATVTIEPEKVAAVQPDLIVTLTFGPDNPDDYWSFMDHNVIEQVKQIAPIVAISGILRADEAVKRFGDLAAALGIDLESSTVAQDQAAFTAASNDFTAAVKGKSGLTAMFVAPTTEEFYIANPKIAGDIQFFRNLGLEIPDVDTVNPTDYWETLSWEQSLKYETDVIFVSSRDPNAQDLLTSNAAFSKQPAVKAKQLGPWNQDFVLSYPGMTTILNGLLDTIKPAKADVVS